jgi:hypothetical protein
MTNHKITFQIQPADNLVVVGIDFINPSFVFVLSSVLLTAICPRGGCRLGQTRRPIAWRRLHTPQYTFSVK